MWPANEIDNGAEKPGECEDDRPSELIKLSAEVIVAPCHQVTDRKHPNNDDRESDDANNEQRFHVRTVEGPRLPGRVKGMMSEARGKFGSGSSYCYVAR